LAFCGFVHPLHKFWNKPWNRPQLLPAPVPNAIFLSFYLVLKQSIHPWCYITCILEKMLFMSTAIHLTVLHLNIHAIFYSTPFVHFLALNFYISPFILMTLIYLQNFL
jgi:hypothetical protein